jgi:hypothetical protein
MSKISAVPPRTTAATIFQSTALQPHVLPGRIINRKTGCTFFYHWLYFHHWPLHTITTDITTPRYCTSVTSVFKSFGKRPALYLRELTHFSLAFAKHYTITCLGVLFTPHLNRATEGHFWHTHIHLRVVHCSRFSWGSNTAGLSAPQPLRLEYSGPFATRTNRAISQAVIQTKTPVPKYLLNVVINLSTK